MSEPNSVSWEAQPASEANAPRRKLGCAGAILGIIVVLALLAGFVFYRVENASTRLLSSGEARLENLVRDAFVAVARVQPHVTVNEQTVFEQNSPVMELAVLERDLIVERDTAATWLASTKRMRLRAVYHVKAGYDLRQPFNVHIENNGKPTIKVELPPAKILSVEQVKFEALDLKNGLWNRIKPEELAAEVNTLNTDARLKAVQAGMPHEAAITLAEQLRQKFGTDYQLEITTSTGVPLLPENKPLP